MLGSLRALAGAVAQALYVSILDNEQKKNLPKYVSPAALDAGLPESSLSQLLQALSAGTSLENIPGATESVIAAAKQASNIAYSESFRIVFYCTIPFSVIMIVSSCFVPNMKDFIHYDVARRLQGDSNSDSKAEVEMVEHVV